MNHYEERFDDFKVVEEIPEIENVVANTIVANELTEVEQYKEEIIDGILNMGDNPKETLTQLVVEKNNTVFLYQQFVKAA